MPTYEYRCTSCEHQFEQFQSMKDKPLRKCPQCGKNALERLIGTGAAVIFKGSGFYQTDYRSESYKAAAKAESGGSSGGDANPAEGAKSDATATKAEPATPAAPKVEAKPEKAKAEPGAKKGKAKRAE
jgi:putative FmdB family regulatory protein